MYAAYKSPHLRGKKSQTNAWKIKNATGRFIAQLYPSNMVNVIFCLVS